MKKTLTLFLIFAFYSVAQPAFANVVYVVYCFYKIDGMADYFPLTVITYKDLGRCPPKLDNRYGAYSKFGSYPSLPATSNIPLKYSYVNLIEGIRPWKTPLSIAISDQKKSEAALAKLITTNSDNLAAHVKHTEEMFNRIAPELLANSVFVSMLVPLLTDAIVDRLVNDPEGREYLKQRLTQEE